HFASESVSSRCSIKRECELEHIDVSLCLTLDSLKCRALSLELSDPHPKKIIRSHSNPVAPAENSKSGFADYFFPLVIMDSTEESANETSAQLSRLLRNI